MKKLNNHKLLVILAFSMILSFGLIMNVRGLTNPLLQDDYGINYSQLGTVLMFFSIGASLASFFSGFLIETFSLKHVFRAGLVVGIIGLISIYFTTNYYLLMLVIFIIGLGMGTTNVSANSLASRIFTKNKGKMMNLFHFFFGMGSASSQLYAPFVISLGFRWEAAYSFGVILLIGLFGFTFIPTFPQQSDDDSSKNAKVTTILKDIRVWLFILMFSFYVGAEIGMSSWLGVYLDNIQQRTPEEIGAYMFGFFVLFTIGRLIASFIVERVGYIKTIIISAAAAMITIAIGLLGPKSFAFFFSLTGLFLAPHFATIQAVMFEVFDENVSAIVGLTLTAGSVGNILFANKLAGAVNQWLGIQLGFGIFIVYLTILIGITIYLRQHYVQSKS
ncbi:MFS transporter [Halanaerobacter jeridensis]|uniref:Fucose permease n=1 Tax=Halanaerobacter jeridensis TaxID=706427 RepID=A0A939BNF6_9FIRM|nr:MFS transporter [Halanaerobacter jeridensis]MBM7555397.1 fucose permease [Halanaerobacter jeridensis]